MFQLDCDKFSAFRQVLSEAYRMGPVAIKTVERGVDGEDGNPLLMYRLTALVRMTQPFVLMARVFEDEQHSPSRETVEGWLWEVGVRSIIKGQWSNT